MILELGARRGFVMEVGGGLVCALLRNRKNYGKESFLSLTEK